MFKLRQVVIVCLILIFSMLCVKITWNFIDEKKQQRTTADQEISLLLSEYENNIHNYVKVYKKALNGDRTSLKKYSSFMLKNAEIEQRLNHLFLQTENGDYHKNQFKKLQNKFLNPN
ncbi:MULTISPECIES: hypothetical protein [Myroides]|uniref:Uncharacterized protein n=1 Tax=Myroides albus TaxID=2562892 RepID=A0A6I3LKW8_9FLAO|nr:MULTISPECIES: hypothetical protein [Myroides]MTG96802.1 hypothetical protein [Myroides albus]UVD78448.1 hypothetical protein NWE55_09900 [Myroides albus]